MKITRTFDMHPIKNWNKKNAICNYGVDQNSFSTTSTLQCTYKRRILCRQNGQNFAVTTNVRVALVPTTKWLKIRCIRLSIFLNAVTMMPSSVCCPFDSRSFGFDKRILFGRESMNITNDALCYWLTIDGGNWLFIEQKLAQLLAFVLLNKFIHGRGTMLASVVS